MGSGEAEKSLRNIFLKRINIDSHKLFCNINNIQEEKSQLNSKSVDFRSSLSSLNTEIKMNQENIQELDEKKILIKFRYK